MTKNFIQVSKIKYYAIHILHKGLTSKFEFVCRELKAKGLLLIGCRQPLMTYIEKQ